MEAAVSITLSTGKKIELSPSELSELLGIFPQPKEYLQSPYIPYPHSVGELFPGSGPVWC
jgi:hypothetical protein